jgi:diamine N-acetyltransferase
MAEKLKHISIRCAEVKDASVLSQMGSLTFTQSYARIIPAEELVSYTSRAFSPERIQMELDAAEVTYLLALGETGPCGYSKLAPSAVPPAINGPNPVELARLYVLPEWIGKGIGTVLIEKSLAAALERGYRLCWLRVWTGNERAIDFYHCWGFREVGREPYEVGKCSETVLLMMRGLKE